MTCWIDKRAGYRVFRVLPAVLLALVPHAWLAGQEAEVDRERGMWNTEFQKQRAPVAPAAANTVNTAAPANPGLMLGITAWKLRESKSGDRTRMLVHEGSASAKTTQVEYTPERMPATALLGEGDKVRITVEPAASGFLYVVSREVYAGGKYGDPYLIFPSTRIHQGQAKVSAGEVVDIPEWNNATPYLTIRKGRPDETGEQVMVLLAPREMAGLRAEGGAQKLSPALIDDWTKRWGSNVKMLDSAASSGAALSQAEMAASAQAIRMKPGDPVPQILFRAPAAGSDGLMVSYTLRLKP